MKQIRPHDVLFFSISVFASLLLIRILAYFIFFLDEDILRKFWIPNISYLKVAVGLVLLLPIHMWCIRCWKYKETGFFTKITFWAHIIQIGFVFMLLFFFLIMAVLILFFNAPNSQNPFGNCKGIATCCAIVFTVSAIRQSHKHFKQNKKT